MSGAPGVRITADPGPVGLPSAQAMAIDTKVAILLG